MLRKDIILQVMMSDAVDHLLNKVLNAEECDATEV